MSEPLNKATSLLGILAFICVMNSSATQEETNKWAPRPRLELTLQAEHISPDEDWLTDADLNILENEAHAPGRRGGWSRGDAWKNIRIANRGTYSTELMGKWNAVKQKSSHHAVKSTRYISKTDGRFHLFGFVYDCSHIKGGREGQKTRLCGELKLFGGPK